MGLYLGIVGSEYLPVSFHSRFDLFKESRSATFEIIMIFTRTFAICLGCKAQGGRLEIWGQGQGIRV